MADADSLHEANSDLDQDPHAADADVEDDEAPANRSISWLFTCILPLLPSSILQPKTAPNQVPILTARGPCCRQSRPRLQPAAGRCAAYAIRYFGSTEFQWP